MTTRRITLACALLLGGALVLAGAPAGAQEAPKGWWREAGGYAGVSGLLGFVSDADLDLPDCPACADTLSADAGLGLAGVAGYRFSTGLRLEGEVAYRRNDLDEVSLEGLGTADVNGDVTALAVMGNLLYDFATGAAVTPYLGVGLGFARIAVDSSDLGADDSDTVFAYQLKAGLSVPLSPTLALVGGYAYFATSDPTIEAATAEYQAHTLDVGLRLGF